MPRHRRKNRLALYTFVALTCLIVGGIAVRLRARRAALDYGLELQTALFEDQTPGPDGLPRKPRDIFNEPRMLEWEGTLQARWNLVAIDYRERAEDLRTATTYLREQLRTPATLRFAHPPKLRHFRMDTANHSDGAVRDVMRTLLDDYLRVVGSR